MYIGAQFPNIAISNALLFDFILYCLAAPWWTIILQNSNKKFTIWVVRIGSSKYIIYVKNTGAGKW